MTDVGTDAGWALQSAIFEVLDTALKPVPVFDHVPDGTEMPYVVIGDSSVTDDSDKTSNCQEHDVHIHVWSQAKGRKEVKHILQAVYVALHRQQFPVSGQNLVSCEFDYQPSILWEAESQSYHGISRYRVSTQSTT